jgi:hypothetical protein
MSTHELAEQVREEVKSLRQVQERFLHTYGQLCDQHGGADWRKKEMEMTFHRVRSEVIPIMEHAGMDEKAVQALCSWAEKMLTHR